MVRQQLSVIVGLSAVIAVGIIVGRAEQSTQETSGRKLTEAPAGFATPTLSVNPGSQSVSNGIPEPPNDTFALDQANFESRDGNDNGLGPVYNATICVDCHQNPVTGGPSQITEIRAGHLDANGNFVNPTIFHQPWAEYNYRAIIDQRSRHLPTGGGALSRQRKHPNSASRAQYARRWLC